MKRSDLIREIQEMGCVLVRHGHKHDWYQNPRTKISQPVPRHQEISNVLAKRILKMLSDDAPRS
ncbi:MAG: type II toxin-antitoxin system HicA family toxin [Firmicutes bacterium]|nr:type II toxin-antitoxin system HicA family toxin [Bacillota bacterium]